MYRSRAWRLAGCGALVALLALVALGCDSGGGEGGGGGGGGAEAPADRGQREPNPRNARFDLTIGDLIPLSGELEPFGPPGRKASELAVRRARAALKQAGVKGVEVDVEHADTGTSPEGSVSAARRLVADGSTCLAGAWASTDTIPAAQSVATPQRTPMISPASTSAQITTLEDEGFLFRTAPSNNLQGETLADVVARELGGTDKRIAVAARNDAYGQGLANSFRRAWEANGGELAAGPVLYDPENRADYQAEVDELVSGDPDGYVIVDFPDSYSRLGQALVESGAFDAGKLFLTDGIAGEGLPESIPAEALEGARGTRPATPEKGKAPRAFGGLYARSNIPPQERQTFDAQNFDATMLCFLAAVAAGSKDGEAIQGKLRDVSAPPGRKITFEELGKGIKALRRGEDIDYEGASGPVDFDAAGDPTVGTYEVFRFGDDRDFEVLRQIQAKQGQGAIRSGGGRSGGRDGGG